MARPLIVPKLMTLSAMALLCEVSVKTVRRWIGSGELRAHRLGRQIRIAEEDAAAFIAARRR